MLLSSIILLVFGVLDVLAQQKAFDKCNKYYGYLTKNLRIVQKDVAGGYPARRGQLPFMAALGYQFGSEIKYLCGGSLISEDFVTTAAHCIYSRLGGIVKYVRLGDLNLNSTEDDEYVQMFEMKKYYVHPEYKFPEKYHDIALIKLNKSATFSDFNVKPICISPGETEPEYLVGGWGQLEYGQELSKNLQMAILRPYNIYVCQKHFSVDFTLPDGVSRENQLCAGPIDKIADTCEGDSGGPLAYAKGKAYYLAGVTSFGKPCALGFFPGVYTSVSAHIAWIENTVWPDEETMATDDGNELYNCNIYWVLLVSFFVNCKTFKSC